MNFDRSLDVAAGTLVQLSPLVSRLLAPNPGPFTFKGTGVYILGAGFRVAVIDPGPALPDHIDALKHTLGPRQVSHILVTHTHRDHSPAAAALKAWSGARTYASGGAAPPSVGEGMADEAHDHDFVPDVTVTDGMLIDGDGFRLECVATPGHTANHMCYALTQEKALFSGDHVMGWSTSVIAPPDGNMADYLASLDKLAARDERIFYPTHGSPIADPQAWLGQLIAHRRMREAQILAALARGESTVAELVERLYPGIETALRPAAAQQVAAHLQHLQARGQAVAAGGHWTVRI
ncbi:MAG TPA: MBL fold metallo-hydrolase [Rhizomicrobium sp.]|nr:MBL fold metallo-hydrolase [Rhizomicrobium sp.]